MEWRALAGLRNEPRGHTGGDASARARAAAPALRPGALRRGGRRQQAKAQELISQLRGEWESMMAAEEEGGAGGAKGEAADVAMSESGAPASEGGAPVAGDAGVPARPGSPTGSTISSFSTMSRRSAVATQNRAKFEAVKAERNALRESIKSATAEINALRAKVAALEGQPAPAVEPAAES